MNEKEKSVLINAVKFLLDSSSDSSDDELVNVYQGIGLYKEVFPKIDNFMDVVELFDDRQFSSHFRISKTTASNLIDLFTHSMFAPQENKGGLPVTTTKQHILSFVWFSANKACLRDVANRFGVAVSTLYLQIERVTAFLVNIAPSIIKFPNSVAECQEIAESFEKLSGFPGVIGCIDGTYINIRTPAKKIKSTYTNRHDIPSLTLQGICDARRKFLDVFTGPPGKIHDARILRLSSIWKKLGKICGNDYHLLGDSAYPLREFLLTPYKDYGNLRPEQKKFNYSLSATRVLIENTFGLLKGRFRQLQLLEFHQVSKMAKFIVACTVLHNMCIDNNDFLDDLEESSNNYSQEQEIREPTEREAILRQLGEMKRNFICERLNE